MIDVENVTRKYGEFTAVDNVSFAIGTGEIVGLLGHNGAGKTTIMKMLTGYLEPTAGRIAINGREMVRQRAALQRHIGYLPENCPLYPEMTVIDYLDYAASLHGVPTERRTELVLEAIARTALADKAHQPIGTLSRGYRQRTGVAQAILHNPGILILDEPTNGLDPTQIQQMRELILLLAESSTIIISTHILQEVQAVCDRVIIINSGRKVLDSPINALQTKGRLLVNLKGPRDEAGRVIGAVTGVAAVEELEEGEGGRLRLAVSVREEAREETAAAVARAVHGKDWPLYALHFEARDLENVFAQMSAQ